MSKLEQWKGLLAEKGISLPKVVSTHGTVFSSAFANIVIDDDIGVDDVSPSTLFTNRSETDGLTVDGKAVFAYIRRGVKKSSERKVHFTYCEAIAKYPASRYYCTTRSDGLFDIDNEDSKGNYTTTESMELEPCTWCIGQYYGLEDRASKEEKKKTFVFSDVLHELSVSLNQTAWQSKIYKFSDKSWSDISHEYRESQHWSCEECLLVLDGIYRVFLHSHHRHFDRNFNHSSNLKSLCIRCHADQPGHQIMKQLEQYKQFMWLLSEGVLGSAVR